MKHYNELEFVDAYFINEDRTDIEILRKNVDGDIVPEIAIAKDDDILYQGLLKNGITLDTLHERTHEKIKHSMKSQRKFAEKLAKKQHSEIFIEHHELSIDWIFTEFNDKDSEKLFKFKLKAFEYDFVKNSINRELKSRIRKAKTPIEALTSVIEIYYEQKSFSR